MFDTTHRPAYLAARQRKIVAALGGAMRRRSLSRCADRAVRCALELGAVVHATHPDFGGLVTVGRYYPAGGDPTFAVLHTGGSFDVTVDDAPETVHSIARYFIHQVGKRAAFEGAIAGLRKTRNPFAARRVVAS